MKRDDAYAAFADGKTLVVYEPGDPARESMVAQPGRWGWIVLYDRRLPRVQSFDLDFFTFWGEYSSLFVWRIRK